MVNAIIRVKKGNGNFATFIWTPPPFQPHNNYCLIKNTSIFEKLSSQNVKESHKENYIILLLLPFTDNGDLSLCLSVSLSLSLSLSLSQIKIMIFL